tara:strand:+ start:28166 stop:28903 length:738 start_codon:yes stop_codon:yes gene_type:complete
MASYNSYKAAYAPSVPTGLIIPWSHNSIPNGFLVCGGQAVSRTTYADLFALIGTSYGVGNGSSTFNVPSLDGRQLLFDGTGSDGSATNTVGGTAGNSTLDLSNFVGKSGNISLSGGVNFSGSVQGHPLATNELPSHEHKMFADVVATSQSGTQTYLTANQQAAKGSGVGQSPTDFKYSILGTSTAATLGDTSSVGNGAAHNHNDNFAVDDSSLAVVNSNFNVVGNTVGSSDKLYQSTKLRALIKF